MKTYTQPAEALRRTTPSALRRTSPAALRRTSPAALRRVVALAAAPAIVLAGCSGEAPLTANPTVAPTTGTALAVTTTAPTTTTTSTTEAATSTTPTPAPTQRGIKVKLTDPILGHEILATRVVRNLSWPAGHPVASANFEIIGVLVTVKAGARYSTSVAPSQLTLRLGTGSVAPTVEFGNAYGRLLTTVLRDKTQTGLLVFKIDRNVHPLTLQWLRPAYQVTTTDKGIPAKVIEAKLLD